MMNNEQASDEQRKIWREDETLSDDINTYFSYIKHEQIPKTPVVTEKLDKLEVKITERKKELEIHKNEITPNKDEQKNTIIRWS